MVLFFTHIPFVVNHTINATPPEGLQQKLLSTTKAVLAVFHLNKEAKRELKVNHNNETLE